MTKHSIRFGFSTTGIQRTGSENRACEWRNDRFTTLPHPLEGGDGLTRRQ